MLWLAINWKSYSNEHCPHLPDVLSRTKASYLQNSAWLLMPLTSDVNRLSHKFYSKNMIGEKKVELKGSNTSNNCSWLFAGKVDCSSKLSLDTKQPYIFMLSQRAEFRGIHIKLRFCLNIKRIITTVIEIPSHFFFVSECIILLIKSNKVISNFSRDKKTKTESKNNMVLYVFISKLKQLEVAAWCLGMSVSWTLRHMDRWLCGIAKAKYII